MKWKLQMLMENRDGAASRSYSMSESQTARASRMASRAEQREGGCCIPDQKLLCTCVILGPRGRKTRGRFLPKDLALLVYTGEQE